MISPEIWDDKNFNSLSFPARLMFIGLITNADDLGRLPANLQFLKNKIFGYDRISLKKIKKWRQEIKIKMKNVKFYHQGEEFCQLLHWEKYQYIRKDRVRSSQIPSFCQPTDNQMATNWQPINGIDKNRIDKNRIDKNRPTDLDNLPPLVKSVLKDKLNEK